MDLSCKMLMDDRKKLVLNTIIKEHTSTGCPVGSGVLVEKYKLNVSPATVRNDMAYLEDEGYIAQPHTSAGRVPTEFGYVTNLKNLKKKKLAKNEEQDLGGLLGELNEDNFKQVSKKMAGISGLAVFWAFHKNNLYYTGISNLLTQPEFTQANIVYDISVIIDHMDEIIGDVFDKTENELGILIGSANPFSPMCSSVQAKYQHKEDKGMFGILGPMRMDYAKNIALIEYVLEKLS